MAAVAALATALLFFLAPESRAEQTGRMDWVGVLCLVVSVGSPADRAQRGRQARRRANWWLVAVLTVVAVVAFAAFWRVEDRGRHPLVATRHLRQRSTWALLLTTLLTMTGVFAVMNGLLPTLAQDARGEPRHERRAVRARGR